MESTITVINKVDSEFDDIYRITTENGLVLDISEEKAPLIGSYIEYSLLITAQQCNFPNEKYTIMNGILYNIHNTGILVSFGGLLGNIPLSEEIKKTLSDSVSIVYYLKDYIS